MPNRIARRIANSRIALRARHFSGLFAPAYPFLPDLDEVVSDLFFWRVDSQWDTFFDLCHIAGMINPGMRRAYQVLVRLHAPDGGLIGSHEFEVHPDTVHMLSLRKMLGGAEGQGTFTVFHLVRSAEIFGSDRTCLTERGYVSYRRRRDSLRSYVHGNLYAAGCDPLSRRVRNLGVAGCGTSEYRPQLRLDDCRYAELALSNFTSRPITFEVAPLSGSGPPRSYSLDASASVLLNSQTDLGGWPLVRIRSRAAFLRPLVFKHYETHFDVLHG